VQPNPPLNRTRNSVRRPGPGTLTVTVKIRAVSAGTELVVTQAGIPELIPLEMCYLGWQESLDQLAKLVEPDIPG